MLADFHMHTNLSDGALSIRELVDMYGKLGFGAIAITDHLCEQKTFLDRKEELKSKIDLWEVASGQRLFPSVLKEKLPMVASSDLHRPEQMSSWKTRLSCEKKQEAILESLKRQKVDFYYFDAKYANR